MLVIVIESLIGIILFTAVIVSLTLKSPLTSVGDYPDVLAEVAGCLGWDGMQGCW